VRLNIPPIIPYVVGAMLVLFGSLRIRYLATPRPTALAQGGDEVDRDDGDGASPVPKPARRKEQRRHLKMGVLWIVRGLFLLVSTYLQVRRGR
jgi:hypothetical protein